MAKQVRAFTLVELLVVTAIIGLLVGLMLPAVQAVRESSRRLSCGNHLRQIALAVAQYEATFRRYPTSFDAPRGMVVRGSWSPHAKVLPMMEEGAAFLRINFDEDWHTQVAAGVSHYAVPVYSCPSDTQAGLRFQENRPYVHSTSYGFNLGTWFVYDPRTGRAGDGVFRVTEPTRPSSIRDGLSYTLCASETKAFTSYIRNVTAIDPTLPSHPGHFQGVTGQLKLGPHLRSNTGHTVWCDGRVHHAGFTTVFTPNTVVPYLYQGRVYDIDYSSQQEGRDLQRPTYAAVTARSHHPGGVLAVRMDGAVRFESNHIDLTVWRALGTASGQETEPRTRG
jgi:prepilin-type N-terminal cleavage/methylation domain-containing protein